MIEQRTNMPAAELHTDYRATKRPVFLPDFAPEPWLEKWQPKYLKQVCGGQKIQVLANRTSNKDYETSYDQHRTEMTFGAYVDWIDANPNSNDIYIHAQNQFMMTEAAKPLYRDIPEFEYLDRERERGNTFLWFGPADTVTPLHHDNDDILFVQVYGRKQWRLFSPEQAHLMYIKTQIFSAVDAEQPDLDQHPLFRFVEQHQLTMNPGDALFLPAGHYHHVRALDVSISMSFTNFKAN
jgi:hypothetical protein